MATKKEWKLLAAEEYPTCIHDCPLEECFKIHKEHRHHKNKSCRMYEKVKG